MRWARGARETQANPLPGFTNIPLCELRQQLEQLPRDVQIVVSCNVGRTAYFATRMLQQKGFDAALLPGGWSTWRLLPKKQ